MNEAISACRYLTVEGSCMRVFTIMGAIFLISILMHETISACRFLTMEGSCMRGSTL